MQEDVSNNDPWMSQPKKKSKVTKNKSDKGFLKSLYDFLSSLIMGGAGIIVFVGCMFTVFRHGDWLADISILEWLLFFWLIYCFYAVKELALEQKRSVFLFRWRLFSLTGWTMFWTLLGYAGWFRWGSDTGFQDTFYASNLFEFSLLFVVGLGMGLGLLVSIELEDEDKVVQGETEGKEL
jgi:hypothetical protein